MTRDPTETEGARRAATPVETFLRLEGVLSRAFLLLGAGALVCLAGVSIYQVITRFVFDSPSTWSEVVARSLMVWTVFLCTPYAVGRGELMAFDLLRRTVPEGIARVIGIGVALATLGVLWVLAFYGVALTQRAASQSLAGLEFVGGRVSWVYAAIPVGSGVAMVGALAQLLRVLFDRPLPPPAMEDSL